MRPPNHATTMEFHVSRAARDRYGFDESLFSLSGNVVLADFAATRRFAQRINRTRDLVRHPEQAVNPGELNAMGLIDEILHYVAALYRQQVRPRALAEALGSLEERLGREALDGALRRFAEEFPTVAVYRGEVGLETWLAGETEGMTHREIVLEEILLLWLANANPAFGPFRELFDDQAFGRETAYEAILSGLCDYFAGQPPFGPDRQSLPDMLRSPAIAVPHSLSGQLHYIRQRWGLLLGRFLDRLVLSLDVLQEEERARFLRFGGGGDWDTPHTEVYQFGWLEHEPERFSPDQDWMPRVVLIAKTAYVWLDQLSKRYGRAITKLDQIPDEELDRLARWGFTGLWLIGLWERSRASQRIKQMCGNPEAVASAYSLLDYRIAEDLGGDRAFESLRDRAARRGLRLASDMVPNHVGIDSRWVIQHPDWFVSLDYSPFPSYRFEGVDLSTDERVGIHIEDHYYDRTDAAVVFKRVDRWTGSTRYIYHGNDGTNMPWNDTAQLDYLKPEVREAVIQTILHVARQFPIIRFDAAMTLAKKHYQRLWFPEPGSGGAIPSRAEHGLTRAQIDAAMPVEFWREVVDRVAVEAPGTLLLAEAFWLMEGYFVRTLGMHRVYNSAFMNMLRDEENANYRSVIKNTLEFDPEILKRYVNFMNNPDERTAVDQFGKGDKYLGVCTLMATLPGLPMFGHGQIEGFSEKYGMEYRRAYWDEQPDLDLVARHERGVFPLLHRRRLFAEVSEFLLYDFFTDGGHVNEDVFAYSNRLGGEVGLVLYHNRYAETRGWIRTSAAFAEKRDGGKQLRQRSLGEGLNLPSDPSALVRFRDVVAGLDHLRPARELNERGFYAELRAYERRVFLDWSVVRDDGARPWGQLLRQLDGRGVTNLDEALLEIELGGVHDAFRKVVNLETVKRLSDLSEALAEGRAGRPRVAPEEKPRTKPVFPELGVRSEAAALFNDIEAGVAGVLAQARGFSATAGAAAAGLRRDFPWSGTGEAAERSLQSRLTAALRLPGLEKRFAAPWPDEAREVLPAAGVDPEEAAVTWTALLAWVVIESLGRRGEPRSVEAGALHLLDSLRLRPLLASMFAELGLEGEDPWRAAGRIRASFAHPDWKRADRPAEGRVYSPRLSWLADGEVAWLIGAHESEGVRWFDREHWLRTVWWMGLRDLLEIASTPEPAAAIADVAGRNAELTHEAEASGYRLENLIAPLLRVET